MVFQHTGYYPSYRTRECGLGLNTHVDEVAPTEYSAKKMELFQLRCDGKIVMHPELSGGIHREFWPRSCYAADPSILLMDEPFSAIGSLISTPGSKTSFLELAER